MHNSGHREKIVMVGPPQESMRIELLMLRAGCNIEVVAYSEDTSNHHMMHCFDSKQIWSYRKTIDEYLAGNIEAVFIDSLSFADDVKLDVLMEWFKSQGVARLYVPPATELKKNNFDDTDILFNTERQKYRTHVQLMLTNQCNMNCMYCSHFIPLAKKNPHIYSVESIDKDLGRLNSLNIYLDEIHLFGGEALLHPNLREVIACCRKHYPNTQIRICSNGMLISKLDEDILELFGKERVLFAITLYSPMGGRTDPMLDALYRNNIRFFINKEAKAFYKKFSLEEHDVQEALDCCAEKYATHLLDGRITRCHFPFGAEYFNDFYGKKYFDLSGSILDIHTHTAEEIFDFLRKPTVACKHCSPNHEWVPWRQYDLNKDKDNMNDWLVD